MTTPCPAPKEYKKLYYLIVKSLAESHARCNGNFVIGPMAEEMYRQEELTELRVDIERVSSFIVANRERTRLKQVYRKRDRLIKEEAAKSAPIPQKLELLRSQNAETMRDLREARQSLMEITRENWELLYEVIPERIEQMLELLTALTD